MSNHEINQEGGLFAGPRLALLRSLIADDGFAMTFQSLGQYRAALLKPAVQAKPEQAYDDVEDVRAMVGEVPAQSQGGAFDERDAMALALMDRLGPHALTGGNMSLIEAFEHGWQARAMLETASMVTP